MNRLVICTILGLGTALLAGPGRAAADEIAHRPTAHAYALVVGSNPGGQGQETLRYAEEDAARMARILRELGGYGPGRVQLVTRPTPERLLEEIAAIGDALATAPAEESAFFFYYSGHARANAINLGERELALATLRQKILALPAALKVVVLDACQSGAFSRVKGAEPAADFSFNSVQRLQANGVAVMASSSATELSQESEELQSSFFTHHLLVALRGAGDSNRDGRVSLGEAYRHAYHATLASTARTQVGSQHVILETDLEGRGEIALTYLERADARLRLPRPVVGEVLIQALPSNAIIAEIQKSAGDPVDLALPHGAYRILVRQKKSVEQCDLTLAGGRMTQLHLPACTRFAHSEALGKGAPGSVHMTPPEIWTEFRPERRWAVELGFGLFVPTHDGYTDRLDDFDFFESLEIPPRAGIAVAYRVAPRVEIIGELTTLDRRTYRRSIESGDQSFSWSVLGLAVHARGILEPFSWLSLYAQVGGGLAVGDTEFVDTDESTDSESHTGFVLGAAAGIQVKPWQRLGFYVRTGYDYAPVIENLLDDVHASGGVNSALGVRVAF